MPDKDPSVDVIRGLKVELTEARRLLQKTVDATLATTIHMAGEIDRLTRELAEAREETKRAVGVGS